jgi:hypothetical protein
MRLSPHFTFDELTATWRPEHARNVELAQRPEILDALTRLCREILEPIREHCGAPVVVASGYRYAEQTRDGWEGLDVAIRGASPSRRYVPRSQHTRGEAADIHVAGVPERDVWDWLRREGPPFGQVILEHGSRSTWVHVSLPGRRVTAAGSGVILGEVLDWDGATGRYTLIETVDRWPEIEVPA